jgi:hypothetical protein
MITQSDDLPAATVHTDHTLRNPPPLDEGAGESEAQRGFSQIL